ncbi:multiprotein-bridging factor 1 [Linnemannia zychae]|nr:multiprotein-bridging factor 1 [Linnemannia zychae]
MSGNIGWDDEIVLRKRSDQAKVTRSAADINAARRAGAVVSTERKVVTNAGHVGEDFRRIAKLAETDEIVAPKAVSMDVGKAIAKARIELKLTQKELGVKVNEKQTVINDYEAGRAVPNQQILGKLERALGVKLRGKDIGSPLTFGKNSQLQQVRLDDQEEHNYESAISDIWLEQSLKEAIAYSLSPSQDTADSIRKEKGPKKGNDDGSGASNSSRWAAIQQQSVRKIVFLLADPEASIRHGDGDTDIEDTSSWFYGNRDIREILYDSVRSMEFSIRKCHASIHVDVIRIATDQNHARADIIMEQISRLCTASIYTVISKDELSSVRALTNYFLIQNKDVQVLRILGLETVDDLNGKEDVDLFYRSDHIQPLITQNADSKKEQGSNTSVLQRTPSRLLSPIEVDYGKPCLQSHTPLDMPTECAHAATINPLTYSMAYFTHDKGPTIHLLNERSPTNDVVTRAVINHGGALYIHCLSKEYESSIIKRADELIPDAVKRPTFKDERSLRKGSIMSKDSSTGNIIEALKRPLVDRAMTSAVQDFIKTIVKPNTVRIGVEWNGGDFVELTPPALKSREALQLKTGVVGGGLKSHARKDHGTIGVDMTVVHSTKKIDLETRWLVQWEGERIHPILPEHVPLLESFRVTICMPTVPNMQPIITVMEKLIADARPAVLPGPIKVPDNLPPSQAKVIQQAIQTAQQQQQNEVLRDSAQAILADLWLVGQRFKNVSSSHAAVARQIGDMITPNGLDHNTVKLTFIPPLVRAYQQAKDIDSSIGIAGVSDGGSPNLNRMHGNWNNRGGGNIGGGGNRGGRGGMQGGGARFGDNRGRRGGFGGPGGFRNNAANSQNVDANINLVTNNTEEILSDPTLPMYSMSGRTQPVPHLETTPPTREEVENEDQIYLSGLGEEGNLLRTYWGSRGAQGSSVATVVNSLTSLDSTALLETSSPIDLASIHAAQKRLKRPRLQDFAGRTPVKENGGFSKQIS